MVSPITVTDIVERLTALPGEQICCNSVTERLADGALDEDSLRPYLSWRDDKYARNLIHRCDLFDVILLCWQPGQATPIHNHNGNLGWIRLISGTLRETSYRLPGGATVPDLSTVEIDEQGVGQGVDIEETGQADVSETGTVCAVDRSRAIHRVANASSNGEQLVTLHVYSRPHDSALAFDPGARTCRRVKFLFDTVPQGLVLPKLR